MLPEYRLRNYDFLLAAAVVILNLIGILAIRSAAGTDMGPVTRQVTGVLVGGTMMVVISLIPYRHVLRSAPLIFILCCVFLLMVNLYGRFVGGARRWIVLPVIGQLQPSEFAKTGIVIFFAAFLGKHTEILNRPHFLLTLAGLAAIPLILIASEPDLSTTIVFFVTIAAMVYIAGLSYRWIALILAVLIPAGGIFLYLLQYGMIPFLRDYQARRILAFTDRTAYSDANLQQDNSILAIGSGQLFGKGLNTDALASVKNGNFLSEEQTDFIFAVIGEELGFIGCMAVLLLMTVIVLESLRIAGRIRDPRGKLLASGMAVLYAFQSFCNIAVTTGIFPNTGLTLPFVSYGSSSLLAFYAGFGLVLNVGLFREDRTEPQDDLLYYGTGTTSQTLYGKGKGWDI